MGKVYYLRANTSPPARRGTTMARIEALPLPKLDAVNVLLDVVDGLDGPLALACVPLPASRHHGIKHGDEHCHGAVCVILANQVGQKLK